MNETNYTNLKEKFLIYLEAEFGKAPENASVYEIHQALGRAAMAESRDMIAESRKKQESAKNASYLSAEFLMGRAVYNNLLALGLTEAAEKILAEHGRSLAELEDIEDAALGNGGLGRLAACFLDSAATMSLPLDGYGIRYRYGIFRQVIKNGAQKELADDWLKYGDPWSYRNEAEAVTISFKDQTVRAVPYDMPIFGYRSGYAGNLRLWQSESLTPFDFTLFNEQKYDESVRAANRTDDISRVLYPNDSTAEGKKLRLKQQYFFSSASIQDIIRKFVRNHGRDFGQFADFCAIQLNDTHPVIAIPETIRIFMEEYNMNFVTAFNICRKTFNYTNHTVMSEAQEEWDISLMESVIPDVYSIIVMINEHLVRELSSRRVSIGQIRDMKVLYKNKVRMAEMAVFSTQFTNGVAAIHTEILRNDLFRNWNAVSPERFQNKTNGITQRRWLALCNPELSAFLTRLLGGDGWVTNLDILKAAEAFVSHEDTLNEFIAIKRLKKEQLAAYVRQKEGTELDPDFIFDIQVKRLHEYKRQLLNALSVMDLYFGIKEGSIKDFYPTAFIFGGKSAPGYARAKGIIKYINEVAKLVNSDPEVGKYIKVVFVQNYNVSYAEKLIPAADVSEQISPAGTEASGTGNMKFMLNGAVTIGTYDGANIEIVEEAGEENNYIFGGLVDELKRIRPEYNPEEYYKKNKHIMRALETLVDGTFSDGGTGIFHELYSSVLYGAEWHNSDVYYLLYDFASYAETRLRVNKDYSDRLGFAKKAFINMANAGKFSSDRTIKQYAEEIWGIAPLK
ncbi:MAG: glycogen/starch/alpha-glucan phosphorylase [Oscillospiraceae bacterium]|jgi:starch phosphorylase|nr:glycogen/starch/alpha-glucan phosphorylase [Oscillospiraceae bacterium]